MALVNALSPARPVQFEWGNTPDLNKFILARGENATPLIWSVPRLDEETEWGEWERNAELNFCTVETRTNMINTQRQSFDLVLLPMWDDFKKKLATSGTMSIQRGSTMIMTYPDYTVNDQRPTNGIWDVMKVRVRIRFNNSINPCGC